MHPTNLIVNNIIHGNIILSLRLDQWVIGIERSTKKTFNLYLFLNMLLLHIF